MKRNKTTKAFSYFKEKSSQVEIDGSMCSFGITIGSFHDKAWEIVEMLNFTIELARLELHEYVIYVEYYSKSQTCTFVFSDDLEIYNDAELGILSYEATKIKECAMKTIVQFEMFGGLDHGESTIPILSNRI